MSGREKHKRKKLERRRLRERQRSLRNGAISTAIGGLVVVLIVALLVLARSGSNGAGSAAQAPTPEPTGLPVAVVMQDNFFSPGQVNVPANQPVVFELDNKGSASHNLRIAGSDGKFETLDDKESGNVGAGDDKKFGATLEPGVYNFRCDYHPGMTGSLLVQ